MILTFIIGTHQTDFKVDKTYKIKDVLKVINENTPFKNDLESLHYVTSKRRKQRINILYTFEEAKLFNGDTLIVGQ